MNYCAFNLEQNKSKGYAPSKWPPWPIIFPTPFMPLQNIEKRENNLLWGISADFAPSSLIVSYKIFNESAFLFPFLRAQNECTLLRFTTNLIIPQNSIVEEKRVI